MTKKLLPVVFAILILLVIGFVLISNFESLIKQQISKALDSKVLIKELKIGLSGVYAKDVLVRTNEHVFSQIKEVKLKPYLFSLLNKKVDIKSITLSNPSVTLIHTKEGHWLLPEFQSKSQKSSIDLILKSFSVKDGSIFIKDEPKNFSIELFDINITMESKESLFKSGEGIINASAKIKDGGEIFLSSKGDFSTKIFKGSFILKDLNMSTVKPLLKGQTQIKKGKLSLNSNFTLNSYYIKAPCQLIIRQLEIESKGTLMGVAAPLIIELLEKKGEIVLNFNVWGHISNPQTDLEESLKRKITEELGETVISPFKALTKPFQSLIKRH